eukprot:4477373-Pyramimonas_sp.AAC.1
MGAGRTRRAAPGGATTGPESAPGADQPATGPPLSDTARRDRLPTFPTTRGEVLVCPPLATPATCSPFPSSSPDLGPRVLLFPPACSPAALAGKADAGAWLPACALVGCAVQARAA